MALPSSYSQYNTSKILTASPAELTLLLYEGAIKFSNIAIMKIEQKDVPGAHENIMRVERII
ncbi:MAG: flagellar protein FliS, partial [Lachnospiraceae bacterium]|nr:flagellar protein FliS [Lachnospiraceae bacterium]